LKANPALTKRIRPSKGVHVVLPYEVLKSEDAMLIPKTADGRVVFAIPFEGQLLLGTTDTDYQEMDKEPVLEEKEVDFLLDTLTRYLAKRPDKSLVKAGFGGLRPLLAAGESASTNCWC
jgi:glycerol-3-phosphate dehydrogenase